MALDPFSLLMVATQFAGAFASGEQEGDSKGGSGGQDIASTKKMGFINSNLFRSGASAYNKSRDGKDKLPFKSAPEFVKIRPVSELTTHRRYTSTPVNEPIGYSNPDVQNAIRALANSTNRDIIKLIPMETIQPVKRKQTKTMTLESSQLGNVGP